jgi:cob(I)alamin adenosyltransferase
MKIYTKTGDKGKTGLIGGTRVSKGDLRIETYGTVDELNAFIGLIRDNKESHDFQNELHVIQDRLFTIGSILATDASKSKMNLPTVREEDIGALEFLMDSMNEDMPELKHFILPGGHVAVSHCHLARCVCRRAERFCVRLGEEIELNEIVVRYLNRLSDYLFVLARYIGFKNNIEEYKWIPKMD